MLKWTTSQRLLGDQSDRRLSLTPTNINRRRCPRMKRRATISYNKENLITSTPLKGKGTPVRPIRSPLSSPFREILNTSLDNRQTEGQFHTSSRHYSATLPTFEEEYSPTSTVSGNMLAMRGLLPDCYLKSPLYISRKENSSKAFSRFVDPTSKKVSASPKDINNKAFDQLMEAIVSSGNRKDKRKRLSRNFNLRRKVLLRHNSSSETLSSSYTPADDPAGDLSFSESSWYPKQSETLVKDECQIVNNEIDSIKDDCRKKRRISCAEEKKCKASSYFEVGLDMSAVFV